MCDTGIASLNMQWWYIEASKHSLYQNISQIFKYIAFCPEFMGLFVCKVLGARKYKAYTHGHIVTRFSPWTIQIIKTSIGATTGLLSNLTFSQPSIHIVYEPCLKVFMFSQIYNVHEVYADTYSYWAKLLRFLLIMYILKLHFFFCVQLISKPSVFHYIQAICMPLYLTK